MSCNITCLTSCLPTQEDIRTFCDNKKNIVLIVAALALISFGAGVYYLLPMGTLTSIRGMIIATTLLAALDIIEHLSNHWDDDHPIIPTN